MSVSGLNQQYLPNTLDGLNVVEADQVYIDGQLVNLDDFVTYENATRTLNMGVQNIQTSHDAITGNDVVNKTHLDNVVSNLSIAIAGSFLDKVTTAPQTVVGPVTYTNTLTTDDLLVPTTKKADLAEKVQVDINHQLTTNDTSVTAGQYFGTITSSLGVYQSTSSQDMGILVFCSSLTVGKRYKVYFNALSQDPSNPTNLVLYGSSNGTASNTTLQTEYFNAGSTIFRVFNQTFTASYPYVILVCFTAGGGATVKWYGLQVFEMGVELENVTLPLLTASKVPVLNSRKQLVASGVDASKIDYLDNVTSDIQTQLNSKLNLSGSNANQDIVLGSYKVQSTATPTLSSDYTNKTYVDTAIATAGASYVLKAGDTMTGTLNMGTNKITSSYTALTSDDLTNKNYVDYYLGLKANLGTANTFAGVNTFNNTVNLGGYTASRVLTLDASKNISTSVTTVAELSYVSGVTSAIQTQLNGKASLSNANTFAGVNTFNNTVNLGGYTASRVLTLDASKNISTSVTTVAELSYVSGVTSAIQTQLNGKASLSNANTFADVNTFNNTVNLGGYTASRALALDSSRNIVTSATTDTELNYLSGTTSSVQNQLNTKASTTYVDTQDAQRVAKSGDTMSGSLTVSGSNGITVDGTSVNTGVLAPRFYLSSRGDNQDNVGDDNTYGPWYGVGYSGIPNFLNKPCLTGFYGCAMRSGLGFLVLDENGRVGINTASPSTLLYVNGTGGFTDTVSIGISGASANTTPNMLFSSSAQHVDNGAGQVYLFSATNGHLGIQRNTVRNATTACLALGTADTEQSEVISYKANGSGYMPLAYAGSVHAWVVGNSTDTELVSYSLLGQTGFDGSNNVNLQCQANQYGRNRLYMTGRYEGYNDAWSFATGRNSIIFRTQSSLNSAYTNRWAIQNFADKLGILSSNTPTMVFSGSYVGIGTTSPSNELQVVGTTTTDVLNVGGTDHFRIESFSGYRRIQSFGGQPLSINPLGNNVGIGTTTPSTLLEVVGGGTSIGARNTSGGDNYCAMRLGNDSGFGCYLFLNSSGRTGDGGTNTATLRNDLGTLRILAQYSLGITIDNDGCMKANCGTVSSTNPGSANMAGYFGITRADLRNSAGLWTGIDSGNNVWQLSLRPDVSWNGWNGRGASYTWYVSNGPTTGSLLINNNGAVNVAGNTQFAVPNGYMARGSLTIGSTDANYGWGSSWTSSTAGLLLECADLTEIAVHDAGHRVASMIAYAGGAGRNWLVLGRDMGWGASYVTTTSTFSVATDSQYGRFNVYNPDGSYSHWGTSERVNYVRGGKTLFDTATDTYWHLNWYYDAYSPGAHLHNSPGTWAVSIWATGTVVTNAWFGTVSDKRIKKNIKPVGSMLDTIKRIEVVSFDFIDSNNKRDECGIIAQQVEEVFPNIVDKSVGVVPNILKRATSFQKDNGTLTVFYPRQPEDVMVGERVKLMFGIVGATEADSKKKGEYTEKVLQVEPDSITVEWTSSDEIDGLSLIVYGKEVDDFRNVDKEQFGVMAIKGIQELSEQIEEQQKRIATLEAREGVWVEHAKEQEGKIARMQKDMEKMAGLLTQLISRQ